VIQRIESHIINCFKLRYNKTLIYHIGYGAGFYAEYMGLVCEIALCSEKKINFKLFSKDANFRYKKGWSDYFLPFCEEVNDDFHITLNRRNRAPKLQAIIKGVFGKLIYGQNFPDWLFDRFRLYMIKQYIREPYYKYKYNFDYFTFELWNKSLHFNPYYFPNKQNEIIKYDNCEYRIRDLIKVIIGLTYKFSSDVEREINVLTSKLLLESSYIGMHIRAGDKILENIVFEYNHYFELLKKIDAKKKYSKIFILTDDYTVIESIRLSFPEYEFYTLCSEEERGYDNSSFSKKCNDYKRDKLINMFASVELLVKSSIFIGVYNSNLDMFIDFRRDKQSYYVDKD